MGKLRNPSRPGNFYPRSPCGERRDVIAVMTDAQSISIHALLAESDGCEQYCIRAREISIHALLAESDRASSVLKPFLRVFLSTLSLRRATCRNSQNINRGHNFYPRSPCGERQPATSRNDKNNIFLSTLSLRRATSKLRGDNGKIKHFYPRSPCGERPPYNLMIHHAKDFYPRSPCGERLISMFHRPHSQEFLSTLSLRRATKI